jgi:hypothetical protein
MTRKELKELHYITAISNLPSIMEHGLLSHKHPDPAADGSAWEREIDERVYRLYGLTLEEIRIVEETCRKG